MNIQKMMKDLQKMQAKMQDEIDRLEVEGSAGGGAVLARMNGKKDLLSITLAPDAVPLDDLTLLQDLVVAAVNDAGRRVDAEVQRMTAGMAGGLKIPGMS